jgi:signal transduction histidine kinase
MSFKFKNRLGLRLTRYFGLLTLGALGLCALVYASVAAYLHDQDREAVRSALSTYAAAYQRGGSEAVQADIATTRPDDDLFVHVRGAGGGDLLVHLPARWDETFDLNRLSAADPDTRADAESWMTLPEEGDEEDGEVLEVATGALPDGARLTVGQNSEGRQDFLEQFRNTLAAMLVIVMVTGVAVGGFLSLRALRPLQDFLALLRAIIATGRLNARAPVTGRGDELDKLGLLFNTLLDRIQVLIIGMRNTLDHVAHDLRTPMTRLRGAAETALQGEASPAALREALAHCVEESDRIMAMLNTLMDISEAETGAMKLETGRVSVHDLVRQVMELYGDVAAEKEIAVTPNVSPALMLTADRNRMLQVLANLLDNALKYTPRGGHVSITGGLVAGQVVLTVTDTGIGIPMEELPKIWDRLFRGDKSRSQRGLGLGLSLVKAIVSAHRGAVGAENFGPQGARFTVSLPA